MLSDLEYLDSISTTHRTHIMPTQYKPCYLCCSTSFSHRKGIVRDKPDIRVLECNSCGLVALEATSHIGEGFYENSKMHGSDPKSIPDWLKEVESDDMRRFEMLKSLMPNKRILDFGCGAGGFLLFAKTLARDVVGIKLESRIREYWANQLKIVPSADDIEGVYDLITAFHVLEHLPDPRATLKNLSRLLGTGQSSRMVIEVPNANDALLTLFDCDAFQRFTYWSNHLYLFSSSTLELLARQAGLKVVAIQHYQRYPLSNHLHWLGKGKAGGHQKWSFLDTPHVKESYANALASIGKSDTLVAYLEKIS